MSARNWVVWVRVEDDDPGVFGPYSQARAEWLAERFNGWCDRNREEAERAYGYIHASAGPIQTPSGARAR